MDFSSWCWRRNKDSLHSTRKISCFIYKFWDFCYSDSVCATFFYITRLVFAWAATSACSSCLHSAVLLVSITKLLVPNSAFHGSGAAAEISIHNRSYPLITSHYSDSIVWHFFILSLLRYQKQRLWGCHVAVTAAVATNSFCLRIRPCTEADG